MNLEISEVEACALEHALNQYERHPNGGAILTLSPQHRQRVADVLERIRAALEEQG